MKQRRKQYGRKSNEKSNTGQSVQNNSTGRIPEEGSKEGQKREVYVIPLIEHKSYVDYDVQMQLLRYISVI